MKRCLGVGWTVYAVRPFLLSRVFYGLHGQVADISEIDINLLLGSFCPLFCTFVDNYLLHEGSQDFNRQFLQIGIFVCELQL